MSKDNLKVRNQPLQLREVPEDGELPEGTLPVRVSKEVTDAYGTIFSIEGMDITRLQGEAGVYLGHSDRVSADNLPVALIRDLHKGVGDDGVRYLDGDLFFDLDDPVASETYRKMKAGFMSSVSIKAQIDPDEAVLREDGVLYFGRSTLIGVDIVGRGGNAEAVVQAREGLAGVEDKIDHLQEALEETRARWDEISKEFLEVYTQIRAEAAANEPDEDETLIDGQEECEPEEDIEPLKARTYLDELLGQTEEAEEGDSWLDDFDFS